MDEGIRGSLGKAGRGGRAILLAAAGFGLYWLALPPVGWFPLAWLVFVPWTFLFRVGREECRPPNLRWMFAVAWIFWLATLYFIPLPHWAMWLAWPALAGWCALFFVAFCWTAERLIRCAEWPAVVALPLTWAVLEWVRHWLLTGFGMALLGHTQYCWPAAIQAASVGGDALVSCLVALGGAGVAAALNREWTAAALAVATVNAALAWGIFMTRDGGAMESPGLAMAVVQGSIDTVFPESAEAWRKVMDNQFSQYTGLSREARNRWPDVRLLVWPEGMFVQPLMVDPSGRPLAPSADADVAQAQDVLEQIRRLVAGPREGDPDGNRAAVWLLTGIGSLEPESGTQRNSAALFDPEGRVAGLYHKNHRVLFGEYVPLAEWLPWLDISPNGRSLRAGQSAVAMELDGTVVMPEICFETTVPHLIARHWNELHRQGRTPDAIVCLTNDGWFFGTSCLDLHLACGVFRAVETATPVVTAANTGLSAHVDAKGRIVQVGARRDLDLLRVEAGRRPRGGTIWLTGGKWIWRTGFLAVLAGLLLSGRKSPDPAAAP